MDILPLSKNELYLAVDSAGLWGSQRVPVVRVRGSNPWVPRPRPSQKGAGMCSMRPPAAHEVRLSTGPWHRSLVHPLVSGRRGRKWVRSPPSCQPRWVTGSESSQGAGISDLDPPFAPPDRLHAAPSSSSRACSTMTASWTSATAAAKMAQGAQQHPTYGRGLCRFSRPTYGRGLCRFVGTRCSIAKGVRFLLGTDHVVHC